MLGFLFGFNARLGRLHFLFSMTVVTVLMVAIYFAVTAYVFQTTPKGTMPDPTSGPFLVAALFYGWLTITLQSMRIRDIGWDPVCVMPAWIAAAIVDGLVAAAVFYGWLTITLQSMRIRDIGWDPVCVMPAWIAAAIVDGLVAAKFPAISLANEHGTIVGALINLSLLLALLFCPGGAQDDSSSRYDELFRTPDAPPPPSPVAAPPAPSPTARAANAGFGRRGL